MNYMDLFDGAAQHYNTEKTVLDLFREQASPRTISVLSPVLNA